MKYILIMHKKYLIAGIIILLFAGCKTPVKIQKPYVKLNSSDSAQISYYLPKNIFHIKVKIIREQQFKGPFSDYAGEYLGIDEEIVKYNETTYSIANVGINVLAEPDENQQFYIHLDPKNYVPVSLTSEGIIAGININKSPSIPKPDIVNTIPEKSRFVFTDLSIKPIVDIREEVSYEYKKVDSALVRVPVENEITEVKNFQQMAWSAAKFIATLRESRFRLLAGLSETDQIPQHIENRTEELDNIEQRYLELFTGHVNQDTLEYNFLYEPDREELTDAHKILFYFSKANGVKYSPAGLMNQKTYESGNPLVIKIKPLVAPKKKAITNLPRSEPKGIIYSVPAYALAEVYMKNKKFISKNVPVAQWGKLNYLPAGLLHDDAQIKLDVHTGALLQISKTDRR